MKIARLIVLGASLCLFNACEQQKLETLHKMESAHGGGHGAEAGHGDSSHGKADDKKADAHPKGDGHGH